MHWSVDNFIELSFMGSLSVFTKKFILTEINGESFFSIVLLL